MTEWYYAHGGKQSGPVSFEQLVEIARNGGLNPLSDLVWTSTMKDWIPAGQVPGIFTPASAPAAPPADPSNPYAAPQSSWNEIAQITLGEALAEIPPGSEPVNVVGCMKRGFDLTCRHFGTILLIGLVYFAVTIAVGTVLAIVDHVLGLPSAIPLAYHSPQTPGEMDHYIGYSNQQGGSLLNVIVRQIVSVFLSLGVTRIGLNIVSGKEFSVGMLFGGGRKFLTALGATILYTLMIGLGMLLLIVPGIYLAMRFGQYLTAIVDRDLGIMDSFRYSSSITTNNRMNVFLFALLSMLVVFAGMLACCVGLIFAAPVAWLGWIVVYRWMQYGYRAAMDHHGTTTPMLSNL